MPTEFHPIRVAARRTGLSAHVIRAWEKRYGAVEPKRTPTQRRVYSTEDLERLILLRRATLAGRSIGQIAKLPTPELKSLVEEDESAAPERLRAPVRSDGNQLLSTALEATGRLDTAALQRALDQASISLSRPAMMEQIIVPLMHRIGDAWRDGSLRVAHEHLASALVRSFLGSLDGAFPVATAAPEIVVTTPSGQLHEIGALLAAATAASEGWRATYLGPSLPADEIAAAVRQRGARAVALSIVYPTDDPQVQTEIQRLSKLVAPETTILVGGRGAPSYRSILEAVGARHLPDYQSLRTTLESLRQ
ncbi:MAG TPA: MerR family transcriptional regulator [Vicinamibacteria bacterium]|nr:MerR family transcriptional regulator [Vicinamibacteria bacterium]